MNHIAEQFIIEGTVKEIVPLGNGLINDTYLVKTSEADNDDYVLQRINHHIFTDVELLQHNIETVTRHLRSKLEAEGVSDIKRRVLHFIPTAEGKTYYFDGESYWRMSIYIANTLTVNEVTSQSSYDCGLSFGHFEQQLTDLEEPLGETIPDFHNMELRLSQLREAVSSNRAGRLKTVEAEVALVESHANEMCLAEQLHRKGLLPKRICHCDTKVNNMLFDKDGNVLCVIDLDTVMPSFVFSDFGDFLRSAANTGKEDDPDLDNIHFNMEIFAAFAKGYLEGTKSFLLPIEKENLPYAATLFPYMQAVRFLTDYINGNTYYKIQYPTHNLVRTRAQWKLYEEAVANLDEMKQALDL